MDIQGDGWKVLAGSCLDRLLELQDCSIDAVVTDPPYELGFMGKSWDSSGIAYNVEVWRQCLRVLKPGGHILAFGGSRTWHRLAVAVEDAGFELRDSIAWIYGSGFPKSLDVSKAIDKAAGAEREVIGTVIHGGRVDSVTAGGTHGGESGGYNFSTEQSITSPATDDAKRWQGWGTALKPAFEPVVVGRKPLTGTVAANVLEWGVGGLNIDGTRIASNDGFEKAWDKPVKTNISSGSQAFSPNTGTTHEVDLSANRPVGGRWPSNVMLDEFTAGLVDQQSGISPAKPERIGKRGGTNANPMSWQNSNGDLQGRWPADIGGGASRFFYVAKASKRDRNEGLDGLEETTAGDMVDREEGSAGMNSPRAGAGRTSGAKNFHPTVKPTDLMRNLIRLVTPLGGTVLDPFTGSGSTGKAAILEGMQFVGCELTPEYLPIIEGRINYAVSVKEQEALAEDEKLF